MALHKELPIYKVAYDLLGIAMDLIENIPRAVKVSIGNEVRDECVGLMALIFRANCARDKTPHLETLSERVQIIELWFLVLKDKRFISKGQYAKVIDLTDQIGKQTTGWRKSQKKASPAA